MSISPQVSDAVKTKAHRVMGIDASTKGIAFSVFEDGALKRHGIFRINGADIYERINDAHVKTKALLSGESPDYVAIEAAVFVNSPDAAIKLAYVYGAVMAGLLDGGAKVIAITPMQWQNFIGNKALSKDEKAQLKKDFPGKSVSWYSNKARQIRKQRTLDYFNSKYGLRVEDDNVGDALGLAYFAITKLTRS